MMIIRKLSQCFHDETGATAIEYGLIAALISIVIVSALQLTGTSLSSTFATVANDM
jgi:pilus assembly protein Flp/PilA